MSQAFTILKPSRLRVNSSKAQTQKQEYVKPFFLCRHTPSPEYKSEIKTLLSLITFTCRIMIAQNFPQKHSREFYDTDLNLMKSTQIHIQESTAGEAITKKQQYPCRTCNLRDQSPVSFKKYKCLFSLFLTYLPLAHLLTKQELYVHVSQQATLYDS